MKGPVPVILVFWIAAAAVAGAPLRCTDVAADPARLLHIDFDAMRETYVGKYFLYQLDKPEMHSNMVAFQSLFSFDLRTQLHGLTIYTANSTPDDSVVITYVDYDPARFVKLITAGETAFTITNNQHLIYSWIDKGKNSGDPDGVRKYGVLLDGRVLAANTRQSIIDALTVVDRAAPNLSPDRMAKGFDSSGATNFVLAGARNLEFLGSDSNMALLKLSKWVKLQVSESDEVLKAKLTVEAANEQTARQTSLVAQGLIAMLGLQNENPRAAKLAAGMTVHQEASGFRVEASASSKDAMAAMKAYNDKKNPPKPAGP